MRLSYTCVVVCLLLLLGRYPLALANNEEHPSSSPYPPRTDVWIVQQHMLLEITPEQETLWSNLAQAIRSAADPKVHATDTLWTTMGKCERLYAALSASQREKAARLYGMNNSQFPEMTVVIKNHQNTRE